MITNMSPLVLTDAAATPVTHTFTPASRVAENTARWVTANTTMALASATALLRSRSRTLRLRTV